MNTAHPPRVRSITLSQKESFFFFRGVRRRNAQGVLGIEARWKIGIYVFYMILLRNAGTLLNIATHVFHVYSATRGFLIARFIALLTSQKTVFQGSSLLFCG